MQLFNSRVVPRLLQSPNKINTLCSKKSISVVSHKLNLLDIEKKWKKEWAKQSPFPANESGKKKYVLSMFPYPSGSLHMGHVRVYTISDTLSRYYRMKGFNVIHPMGWDAFGLPAENAAIEHHISPKSWTKSNIEKMKHQFEYMNVHFDWDREIVTCDPSYYKWGQYLFTQLFRKGLAYQADALVNWDPVDCTVLANEQVDSQGRSWRSGAVVEKKNLCQWFFKTSDYSERLLKDLEELYAWPEKVKKMQQNWIGKSEGLEIQFKTDQKYTLDVYTTRPETIFGSAFIGLSKSHPLVQSEAQKYENLSTFLKSDDANSDGFELPIVAYNPLTAAPIPVYYAPYVVNEHGTGAVMGVPMHDLRDFTFATENGIPFPPTNVVLPLKSEMINNESPYTGNGVMSEISGEYSGMKNKEAAKAISKYLQSRGIARFVTKYRLRDWLVSRQRFWGTPIPIVHCDSCGAVPVPEHELPVQLPELTDIYGKGSSPLTNLESWVKTNCPQCKKPARRETDTMDTFVDSSWYFFRFLDPKNKNLPFDPKKVEKEMPVDIYIGGIEHSILHLLYSRFLSKVMHDIGLWKNDSLNNEPFTRLITQGMVHGPTYVSQSTGRILKPSQVEKILGKFVNTANPDDEVELCYFKMSKSKHNGVDPISTILRWGSDVTRAHLLFSAPVDGVLQWDSTGIVGAERWLLRLATCVESIQQMDQPDVSSSSEMNDKTLELLEQSHDYMVACAKNYENIFSLNVIISDSMKLTITIYNCLKDNASPKGALKTSAEVLIRCIAPIVPCISSELWNHLGHKDSVYTSWPSMQKPTITKKRVSVPVQINGKWRFQMNIPSDSLSENLVMKTVLAHPDAHRWLKDKKVVRAIIKPKVVSLVVK
ncbi:mitochondrial leucine-tRNA ligase [Schizosaccharomyces osmophilus]|uniref:leucine--tRNA ligase n=1 Tax=Schizosaccharomyces osmophilus TaxID=2545709 RepID=A0AAF0ARR6_9SCHI|nr:mitochondrial leucine-tRNA ligase [Schizosaccharomyces osmophilus]WBW70606.1 mitochondrial leucine-tRNA ligase [Schizosaccharomyces osmophilus]